MLRLDLFTGLIERAFLRTHQAIDAFCYIRIGQMMSTVEATLCEFVYDFKNRGKRSLIDVVGAVSHG